MQRLIWLCKKTISGEKITVIIVHMMIELISETSADEAAAALSCTDQYYVHSQIHRNNTACRQPRGACTTCMQALKFLNVKLYIKSYTSSHIWCNSAKLWNY